MDKNYVIKYDQLDLPNHAHFAPVMTLGNGYIGCRGFLEESNYELNSIGGIYLSGLFGWANYTPWTGKGHELVNSPNGLWLSLIIDSTKVELDSSAIKEYHCELDMFQGVYRRRYLYCKGNIQVEVHLERFVSFKTKELIGQKLTLNNRGRLVDIEVIYEINDVVTNLNEVSSEPWPLQPGKKQLETVYKDSTVVEAKVLNDKQELIAVGQRFYQKNYVINGNQTIYCQQLQENESYVIERLVSYAISRYHKKPKEAAVAVLNEQTSYATAFDAHQKCLRDKWLDADVVIEGNKADQLSLRYNIFQLMQACPEHDEHLSIGARGLTGEMYEGCVFWDTEIFMLPFFVFSNPKAAKNLLMYRYHTLTMAKEHAKANYFEGAMYGWQVNEFGQEQTPQGIGAYYSLHVIADIAYAISQYWYATKDITFMKDYGMEILIETARFWKSRVQRDPSTNQLHLLGVRGPNEYDVIVNNNTYTNLMAIQNLELCKAFMAEFKLDGSQWLSKLTNKINFKEEEVAVWDDLIEHLYIPYLEKEDLYLEDDRYHLRRSVVISDKKKTKKRIIDTTIPYEALTMYQISKQADVLHVMINLPWMFTQKQMLTAWDYYVPKTCFDSSLAYSMHALMGARLNKLDEGLKYFRESANLDINNQQMNTISGLHFANFGGTWQSVVFGFGGLTLKPECIELNPHLPKVWDKVSYTFKYQQASYQIQLTHHNIVITSSGKAQFKYKDKHYELENGQLVINVEEN